MAANLTSGTQQAYEPPGSRLLTGARPDVVLLQEFNVGNNSTQAIRAWVDSTFGANFSYARGASTQQIPNGVISRWPIIDSGDWTDPRVANRAFTWARIDLPGAVDLYAVSLHLLTANATERDAEAAALVAQLQANVPAAAYLVIGGDLNTDSRTEPCFTTLAAAVSIAAPYPADQNGNGNTSANRTRPYDHVLADPDLRARQAAALVGTSTYANGLVLDSRVYTPLSDILPVVSSDSGATAMQHMGVIKDFVVPP